MRYREREREKISRLDLKQTSFFYHRILKEVDAKIEFELKMG